MAGDGQQVDVQRLHVDRQHAGGLGGVHQEEQVVLTGDPADLPDRLDRAEHVAGVAQGDESRLRRRLDELPGYTVFGHRDSSRRVGTLSFRSAALPAAELGGILDQAFQIAVRPGLHCAPYIHRAIGTFPEGTVRVSPGPFTTDVDIDHLARALAEIAL